MFHPGLEEGTVGAIIICQQDPLWGRHFVPRALQQLGTVGVIYKAIRHDVLAAS